MNWKLIYLSLLCGSLLFTIQAFSQQKPLSIGVVGLTHTHVHGILGRAKQGDIEIVGIVEPNRELALRYSKEHGYSMSLVYNTMAEMYAACHPEAVCAFGSIYEHLGVVEFFAPKGIHVMVEKPLAVNLEHAKKMETLAKKYQIELLTNYETTWYPTNHQTRELLKKGTIGDARKIVVRDGHRGPKKLGITHEFLDWLTDSTLNGGGAIIDFGCYGTNLSTWLMDGKKPNSVTAVTQQLQKENNPKVDDESIIILNYDHANAIVEGSWNWPIGRKDLEVYGLTGAIYADNKYQLRTRMAEGYDGFKEEIFKLKDLDSPNNDPFAYFAAVIQKRIKPEPYDLSTLENNMVVMEILDAAVRSAKTGKTIQLK
ncbi:MAG: Gfo/Idh/MocA family oxidoreductase [Bacteroidetes bacterium]|nr:Gfo/Idh/MocA family oxidoreductase [Bacteroidota bacterium]